jgi:hypothetical protein
MSGQAHRHVAEEPVMVDLSARYSRRQVFKTGLLAGGALLLAWPASTSRAQNGTIPANLCQATAQPLLDLAATIEALSTTFYYTAITTAGGFFDNLPSNFRRYLRVTLDEEHFHYTYLVDQRGAIPTITTFYFPTTLFDFGQFGSFLSAMEMLEQTSVALYLAAIRQIEADDGPLTATILAQIAGIEAEQRTICREMAQNAPPAPNNLCFQRADFVCANQAMQALAPYLTGGAGFAGPVMLPGAAAISAAVGTATAVESAPATASSCAETVADLLGIAAAAEALGVTFYYSGIQGGFFAGLPESQQWYLQAALDEERNHLNFLLAHGASAPPDHFFFPAGVFDDLEQFLVMLDLLENLFIGAYLAAIQRLRQLGEPLLAEIAAQILGVEAEHRVLGRVMSGEPLPHDRTLAIARYACLSEALTELTPFATGDGQFSHSVVVPSAPAIDAAVAEFGCTSVPTAQLPPPLFLPLIGAV